MDEKEMLQNQIAETDGTMEKLGIAVKFGKLKGILKGHLVEVLAL